jgi:hypothetical protein
MGSGHVNCPIFRARLLKFSQNYGLSECFQGGKYCGWQRIFRGKYQKKWYLPNSSLVSLEVIANKYICIRVLHSGCNLEVNGQITIVSKYLFTKVSEEMYLHDIKILFAQPAHQSSPPAPTDQTFIPSAIPDRAEPGIAAAKSSLL